MGPVTILLIIVGALIIIFLLDLFLTGGSMTMGTIQGMAMMCSNPIGQAILLALLIILAVLIYGVFSLI